MLDPGFDRDDAAMMFGGDRVAVQYKVYASDGTLLHETDFLADADALAGLILKGLDV